eukprot:10830308-Karenia_brevis.AAC.1
MAALKLINTWHALHCPRDVATDPKMAALKQITSVALSCTSTAAPGQSWSSCYDRLGAGPLQCSTK